MLRNLLFSSVILLTGLSAQNLKQTIRSVKVSTASPNASGLVEIPFLEIDAAWKKSNVDLLEKKFEQSSTKRAGDIIRSLYQAKGQNVKVTHDITEIPGNALEIAFKVIQQ